MVQVPINFNDLNICHFKVTSYLNLRWTLFTHMFAQVFFTLFDIHEIHE